MLTIDSSTAFLVVPYARDHETWIVMCKFSGNIRVDLPDIIYLKQATMLIISVMVSKHRPDQLQPFVNVLIHPCFPLCIWDSAQPPAEGNSMG